MNKTIEIDKQYFSALSRLFSPVVIDNIASYGYSKYLSEVFFNSRLFTQIEPEMTISNFFDLVYNFLFKNYRNEYIYKNVIANKILLGKHSLNTSHMLTEFRAGKCKADVVVVNGTSTVYEIKSEYDSLKRLRSQIQSYLDIFDHVNVITFKEQSAQIDSILPDQVGILIVTDRNTISVVRDSRSNKENINTSILFDSLRKAEYLKIIEDYYGMMPDVPNTQIYKECKNLFCKLSPDIAHDLAMQILRTRKNTNALQEFIDNAPSSLSAYAMSICNETKKMKALIAKFSSSVSSMFLSQKEVNTCITHISGVNSLN